MRDIKRYKAYRVCPESKETINKIKCISCIFSVVGGDSNLYNLKCNYKRLSKIYKEYKKRGKK